MAEYNRQYRESNRENIAVRKKEYYETNRERLITDKREYETVKKAKIATVEALMLINKMNRDIEENANV